MQFEEEPYLSLVVEDDGPGVIPEKESWLFKKRFTTKSTGHGIGLITCQKIIDLHHSSITYDRGMGARFSCRIPIVHPLIDGEGREGSEAAEPLTAAVAP